MKVHCPGQSIAQVRGTGSGRSEAQAQVADEGALPRSEVRAQVADEGALP